METFRRLINRSKLLTNNSDFTLQISAIDRNILNPLVSEACLLADIWSLGIADLQSEIEFDSGGYAKTYFSFNISPGLPKTATPSGIKIFDKSISMTHNGNFTGPRSEIWDELRPTLDRTKHELGIWVPTNYFKLLSQLLARKIILEFPALWEESSGRIYGAIPTYGNLKGYLREKRVI